MGSDHLEPFVDVQGSEEWVRPVILGQISVTCFFHERERLLPHFAELRHHWLFSAEQRKIDWNRRFAPDQASFHERHRKVKSFQESARFRRGLNQLSEVLDDGLLDRDQMADQFSGRPSAFAWAHAPMLGRNVVGDAEELLLRAHKIFCDGLE